MHSFTFFFFNDTATTEIYTLSLHDALPIYHRLAPERLELGDAVREFDDVVVAVARVVGIVREQVVGEAPRVREDLRHRGLDRRELRARALLVAEDVEEDARDLVLRALVPRRRERAVAR